jgi:hypothetical protein
MEDRKTRKDRDIEKGMAELKDGIAVDALELFKAAKACLPYITNIKARQQLGLCMATLMPKLKKLMAATP